MNKEVES